MNFGLNEEQQMLADSVGLMFMDHAAAATAEPASQWKDYCELGLLALPFPEDSGGYGGGAEDLMLVFEAYGRNLATAPFLQALIAGRVLAEIGGEHADNLLGQIMAGEARVALCLWESGARWQWDEPQTQAEHGPDGWHLNGSKSAVLDADKTTWLLCPARTAEGIALFLVPPDTKGVKMTPLRTPDARNIADFAFDAVSLPDNAKIGDPAMNGKILARAIDEAITATCAEMVGAMEQLLAITVEYLGMRKQFGVAIGSFQALQHRAADMLVEIELAKSMTFHAVASLSKDDDARSRGVAAAKALVNRSARFVGQQAIQLHGGMGMTEEYPAGRYFQRLTVLELLFGDTDHHLANVEAASELAA